MTTPSKFSFNSIKEFMSSFTGENPEWGSDPDAELNADFMDEVPDSADIIFTEPAEYSLNETKDEIETIPAFLLRLRDELPLETNRARGEVATAKMVRDQEAFKLRAIHESADFSWQMISNAILQAVGPNRMKVADPRHGGYKNNQIPSDISNVIDGMIRVLRDELIDSLYDYGEAVNDIDIAEWVLSRGDDSHDLEPIELDESYNDYIESLDDWDGAL